MTKYYQWTTGPIFYANLIVAEALGKSGNARVLDLYMDGNNANRAGYVGESFHLGGWLGIAWSTERVSGHSCISSL